MALISFDGAATRGDPVPRRGPRSARPFSLNHPATLQAISLGAQHPPTADAVRPYPSKPPTESKRESLHAAQEKIWALKEGNILAEAYRWFFLSEVGGESGIIEPTKNRSR